MANYWEKKLKELEEEKKSGYWNRKTAELNRDQKRQNASKGKYDDEDDDIAPVRTTTKSKKDEEEDEGLDFFQKGAFEDGFDWSDIPTAILGTAGDAGLGVVKGVGGVIEGVTDLAGYGAAYVGDKLGKNKWATDLRERTKESYVDKLTKPAEEYLDNYSILGRTSDAILQGVGQVGTIMATGGLASGLGKLGATAATSGLMGLSGTGSGMSEAYQNNATDKEAFRYGVAAGASDALWETVFGGMGKAINAVGFSTGLSSLDDIVAKGVSKFVKGKTGQNIAEFLVKSGFEGLEEVGAGITQAAAKKLTYMSEEEFGNILKDENLLEQFIVGAATSGVMQSGLVPGMNEGSLKEANKTGRDFISGLTEGEQKVVDRVVQDEIAQREKKGEKVSGKEKSKIYESVIRDMDKGYISIDTIEEVLGGDTYATYKNRVSQEDALQKEFDELNNKKISDLTGVETTRKEDLRKILENIKKKDARTTLKGQLDKVVGDQLLGSRLRESYNERAREYEDFQINHSSYATLKHHDAARKTIDSAIKAGANNTNRVHDIVDMAAKLSGDTGVVFNFKSYDDIKAEFIERQAKEIAKLEAIEDPTFGQEEKLKVLKDQLAKVQSGKIIVNGANTGSEITISLDSPKVFNRVVGHEITHSLEKAQSYDALKKSLFAYAETKGMDINSEIANRNTIYEGVSRSDPEAELVADLVGDFLFNDSEYIRNLATNDRNLFQRIYDEVKHLLKMATAGSKEARQLERVKHDFEKVYREVGKAQAETKYSLHSVDGVDYVKAEKNTFIKEDGTVASEREIFNSLVGKTISLPDGDIKIVKRLPGKDMYNELSKRYPKHLREIEDAKQLNQSVNHNMSELLANSEATLLNEADTGGRHQKQGITSFDTRTVKFYDGDKAYDIEFSIATLQNGEKVAYAKKFFGYDAELTKKIQTAEARSKQSPLNQQSVSTDNVAQEEGNVKYSLVEDQKTIEFLENQEHMTVYKAMAMVDGKLYPPMASQEYVTEEYTTKKGVKKTKRVRKLKNPSILGRWQQSDERPDLIKSFQPPSEKHPDGYGKFDLLKSNGKTTGDVAYNPYEHTSNIVMNDQFSEAYQRPELVTVEYRIPVSEMTSGYKAQYAKDAVGLADWKAGGVAQKLKNSHRDVYLTRWSKPVRVLPDSEVAQKYKEILDKESGITIPWNVVTPSLRMELEKVGVPIDYSVVYKGKTFEMAEAERQQEVKYSLSDSSGRQLSKEQQEYFKDSAIRDKDGNLMVLYHGTQNAFTVFDIGRSGENYDGWSEYGEGIYLTPEKKTAQYYGDNAGRGREVNLMEMYADIKNPFSTNDPVDFDISDLAQKYELTEFDERFMKKHGNRLIEFLNHHNESVRDYLTSKGFDGVWETIDGDVYQVIAYAENQVKNVDNTSPTEDPDIRFSLSEAVEETKDLMALHNLTEQKLLKSLKLGGLPMPSVAIAKAKDGHGEFGEISLILPKETIDPQSSSRNKLYSGDAWTPTYPKVDYKPSEKVLRKVKDKISGLVPYEVQDVLGNLMFDTDNVSNYLDRYNGNMVEAYKQNDSMKYAYLKATGSDISLPMKEADLVRYGEVSNSAVRYFSGKLVYGLQSVDHYQNMSARDLLQDKDLTEAVAEVLNWDVLRTLEPGSPEYMEYERNPLFLADEVSFRDIDRLLSACRKLFTNGVQQTVDRKAAKELIRDTVDQAAYESWLENLFSGVVEKEGIRNNKDYFTPSGNRRSFEALHYENNLENVIKVMREKGEKGIGFGGGSIFGASTTEFSSVDEMKQASGRLQQMSEEEYQEIKDGFSNRFFELASSLPINKNSFSATDDAANVLTEAVAKYKTRSGIANYLRRELNGWARYSPQVVDDLIELVNDIRNMPTGYFEAKPQRAVGFEEVGVFVIPNNADVKLKQELLNRGYSIAEYDPNVEGDRQKVVNQFEEYKFSISDDVEGTNISRALTNEDIAPIRRSEITGSDFFKQTPPVQESVTPAADDIGPVAENATVSKTENVAPVQGVATSKTETTTEESSAVENPVTSESTKTTRKALHAGIIERVKASFAEKGFDFDSVLRKAKNLSTFATVDNTPQRVMEKALGYKEGGVLADFTVNKVAQNETDGIKWLNSFTDRKNGLLAQISKQYQIKPGSKESAAAQMYAEGFYVDGNNNIVQYGDRELAIDFPDMAKQAQIKGLARDNRIRRIYDDTLNAINESRTRNAYPEIPRLDNYFLHFRAMNDTFSQLGLPFNPNDIRAKDLPTDLNGVTADLKPGQPFFASAMHREGKRTSFDLLGGLEQYLSSAKNQIYHIDDIQNLRALRNYIADTYGQANGLEGLDALSEEEAQQRIEQVYNSHLSTFAKFLNEEANMLAGKTALIDRGLEGIIGRRGMTFLDTLNRQVGANMVGYNVSSSLTNFLAPVQAFAKTNKFDFVKGFAQTVANRMDSLIGAGDNFAENSPVMIRRKGADRFHRTLWQKMSDPGYLLMSAVDSISTEIIARAKYNEFTRKGMDSQKAHFETDKWVSRLIGDRSLGQQPQLYNSKMLGIITKFQLEVRNQLDSQFYDTIQETKVSNEDIQNRQIRNAKTAAKVTSTFVQLAVAQHLFGKAFEAVAGYNPAFDIISAIVKAFGWDDDEESEDTALDNIEQGFFELMEDMPYYSTFTGGRIPIESALPIEELVKGKDQYGNDKSRWETLGEAAPYYFMPGGYGQIKKTVAGLNMFSDDHPIAGSYTDSGKLRFPVEDTFGNRAQAAIFGQWASDNARDYFDNDLAPLPEKQTQEFVDVGMSIQDYRKYRADIGKLGKLEEKIDYINGLNLTTAQKNILVNNLTDRKDPIDMSDYDEYSGLEEFDYANENPEKYAFFDEIGITYETYKSADKDTKKAYDWAFENPDKLPMSKAVARDVVKYRQFTSALNDIKADKDSSGKSISGSRKEKVLAYINGLNIDYGAKLILFKSEYTSDDDSNYEIVEYLNSRDDISYEEMVEILKELGITVRNGTAYWD